MAINFFKRLASGKKNIPERDTKEINTVIVQNEAIGSTGTEIYSGYIHEEYLQSLRDSERADIYDKMRRSDSQIAMLLSSVKNPILSSSHEIQAASDSLQHDIHKEFIEYNLFQLMQTPWKKFLRECLTCIEFGHSFFEIVHQNVLNSPYGSFTGLKKIAWRNSKTIERFNVDQYGDLLSITQYAYGDLQRLVEIPSKFLMHIGLNVEGSNYEGISLLRPCYGNWYRKNKFLKINAIGIEKFAVPTPIATCPQGKEGTAEYTNLKAALKNYATHHSQYIIKPEGWEIDLNTSTYDPDKVEVSIDNEDKRMTKAFLANFLELGTGRSGGGSYALSNDLSDFFLGGIEHIAEEVANSINDRIIKPLIDINFGKQEKYPKLVFSGISDKAGEELASALKELVGSNILTPDDKLEESMRKRFKLPEMSEEGQRKPSEQTISFSEKIKKAINEDK